MSLIIVASQAVLFPNKLKPSKMMLLLYVYIFSLIERKEQYISYCCMHRGVRLHVTYE